MYENHTQLGYTLGKNHFKTIQFCHTNIKKKQVMATTVLTIEDLHEFKKEFLQELKTLLKGNQSGTAKKWMKSTEVRKLLGISPGTLQNLRINGTLPYSKMGGVIYYDHEEIQRILQSNRVDNSL
jgi:predicted transcriptional regulator